MPMGGLGSYGAVSVGTSAVVIRSGRSGRDGLIVQNAHASQILYLGSDASVTTSTGLVVIAGASVNFPDYNGPVYGIASGAATDVRFFEAS